MRAVGRLFPCRVRARAPSSRAFGRRGLVEVVVVRQRGRRREERGGRRRFRGERAPILLSLPLAPPGVLVPGQPERGWAEEGLLHRRHRPRTRPGLLLLHLDDDLVESFGGVLRRRLQPELPVEFLRPRLQTELLAVRPEAISGDARMLRRRGRGRGRGRRVGGRGGRGAHLDLQLVVVVLLQRQVDRGRPRLADPVSERPSGRREAGPELRGRGPARTECERRRGQEYRRPRGRRGVLLPVRRRRVESLGRREGRPKPPPVGRPGLVPGEELLVALRPPHARHDVAEGGAEGRADAEEVELVAEISTEVARHCKIGGERWTDRNLLLGARGAGARIRLSSEIESTERPQVDAALG